tara:strand:+ start:1635 stop:2060 length:426 start_codon:yes stop_codon:yes gene_type:complete
MIRINSNSWSVMVEHAEATYPNECVGAMLGTTDTNGKIVERAIPLVNSFDGARVARYELRNDDLLAADQEARKCGLQLIGIYHSHPDCDAYFSETDLKNSCPWYSFVVLSIKEGAFDHANSWLPDPDQTRAEKENLEYGEL